MISQLAVHSGFSCGQWCERADISYTPHSIAALGSEPPSATPHQNCAPEPFPSPFPFLDMIQHLHVCPTVKGPELNPVHDSSASWNKFDIFRHKLEYQEYC